MPIVEELNRKLKEAMKSGNDRERSVIRMVKSKIGERENAKGFEGEITDEIAREVIVAYAKTLKKAVEEYKQHGDRGKDQIEQLTWDIDYLSPFLPKLLNEAATGQLVEKIIADVGATSMKQMGQIMGAIMKDHKGEVDPGLVKTLISQKLSG